MDEGLEANELDKKLYQVNKEVIWDTRKINQHLNFNVGALLPAGRLSSSWSIAD